MKKFDEEGVNMSKKIVYFMDHYSEFGGAANTLLRQAVLMKKAGKTVIVVVSSWGKICEEYLHICAGEGIEICKLCYFVTSQPEGVDILSIFKNYDDVRDFLQEYTPDLVHSVQLNPTVELACRELKIPHIMNIYQALPAFFKFEYPDIFPHYHICDSLYYANFWQKYLGTVSYCIRTVAEGGERNRVSIDQEDLRFVCVGLLCERKNQLEVIKAFEIAVKRYGLHGKLRLFGRLETAYAELCRQYIKENKLYDCIEIKGFSEDMETIYQNSDVLICGSTSESYPNVISEALAHSVVVISTPVAGVPEVISSRKNGYLCKGYEAADIAECIQEFIYDVQSNSLGTILENAYASYNEIHSPRAVTSKLLESYEDVLTIYKAENGYSVNELKSEFGEFIDIFYKNENCFTNVNYVRASLWKIYYVVRSLSKFGEKFSYYIWGTGKFGLIYKEILDVFAPEIVIAGYIDSYATGRYMGYEIVEPDRVLGNENNVILVGVITRQKEIFDSLNKHNFAYNKNYFTFESFAW